MSRIDAKTLEKLERLFEKYDHDKNGVLSRSEIGEIMKVIKHGHVPSEKEVDECFRNMDINGNGVVEKDEFLRVLVDWLQEFEPYSPRKADKRLFDRAPDSAHQKEKLSHIMEYFHTFHSKQGFADFEEDQRRFYSKPREEYDCPALLFGLKELTATEKTEVLVKLSSIIHVDNFFYKLLVLIWSKHAANLKQALSVVHSMLEIVRACSTLASKLFRANEIYYIFNIITDGSKLIAPIIGDTESSHPGKPLGDIIDRLVELVDIDVGTHSELAEIQLLAVQCLHLYVLGPRVPLHKARAGRDIRRWYSGEFPRTIVQGRSILDRFSRVLIQNQIINSDNQQLLVAVISCLSAFSDGRGPAWAATTSYLLTIGGTSVSMRTLVISYLRQAIEAPMAWLELIHACSAALCVLCGHSTSGILDSAVSTVVFRDANDISETLQAADSALRAIVAVGSVSEQSAGNCLLLEAILVHLLTIFALILPLVPLSTLTAHCLPLMRHFIWAYNRAWVSVEAYKVTNTRANRLLIDLTEGMNAGKKVAFWLLSDELPGIKQAITDQMALGCDEEFTNVSVSALKVVDCFIESGHGDVVLDEYYSSIIFLLNFPDLRHWAVNTMIRLYTHKVDPIKLLRRGFVEALFNSLVYLREFPRLADPYCHMSDFETIYHIHGITEVMNVLLHILRASPPAHSRESPETFKKIRVHSFHVHHVEMVRYLHLLICNEIESGRMQHSKADIVQLLSKMKDLLSKIDELHRFSAIHAAINAEISDVMSCWDAKLEAAIAKYQRIQQTRDTHMAIASPVETQLSPKRLALHSTYVGSQEMEVLVTPHEWYYEGSTTHLRPEKLFLFPVAVSLGDMQAALANHYAHVIQLLYESSVIVAGSAQAPPTADPKLVDDASMAVDFGNSPGLVVLMDDGQLQSLVQGASSQVAERSKPRIHLFVQPPKELSRKSFQIYTVGDAKRTEQLASELWKSVDIPGVQVNETFIKDLYQTFQSKCGGKSEIDVDMFAALLNERGIPEVVSRPLFRAFDRDFTGTLSWREVLLGLVRAKSPEHRVSIAFNAFDADGDGLLDFDETVELCHAHLPQAGIETAVALAKDCFSYLQLNASPTAPNNKLNVKQFEALLNSHKIALDTLLPDSLSKTLFIDARDRRPRSGSAPISSPVRAKTCYAFLKGDCKFGDQCKFSHSIGPRDRALSSGAHPGGEKQDFRGPLKRGYSADDAGTDFDRDNARDNAKRSHSASSGYQESSSASDQKQQCLAFQRGNCKFGENCRFSHS